MARITVEDCIDKFESRFELVLVASNRARKLHSGENPTVEKDFRVEYIYVYSKVCYRDCTLFYLQYSQ